MKKNWPLILAVFNIIILFIISFFIVRNYYSQGLPYYDSIGSYWKMFEIMNTTRNFGLIEGINLATQFSLSWLQSFFAVFAAYILPKSPQALISLNFITCLFLILGLYSCAKILKLSNINTFLILFIPLFLYSLAIKPISAQTLNARSSSGRRLLSPRLIQLKPSNTVISEKPNRRLLIGIRTKYRADKPSTFLIKPAICCTFRS